jgi:tyrosyl-DNA phosphodiesterase-1
MTAARSRSVVLNALERSAFLTDRPVHDLERLERLKRRRGGREDLHGAERPHPKRPTPFRTTNCAPASQDNPRRKEEVANDPGETEVFWNGELRQNGNMHVEPGCNGEDGKPIFRLSQIIGDVRPAFYHS